MTQKTIASGVDHDAVWLALDRLTDPEIPALTLREMGILREVRDMPDAGHGARGFEVVIAPPNRPASVSAGTSGGSAPADRTVALSRKAPGNWDQAPVACPRCGSLDTTETSHFGSTACKALFRCLACMEPFDHFKPH